MNRLAFLFVLLSFSTLTPASDCKLPKKSKLIIGCTEECDLTYRLRLQLTGFSLGYPIEIRDLSGGNPAEVLNGVDAVLVPGGADINPEYYLDDISPELQRYTQQNLGLAELTEESHRRDPFEHEVLRRYSSDERYAKLPLLGICRGMQMMSVVQGIPLYLDIKTELKIPNRRYRFDRIRTTVSASTFKDLYGKGSFFAYKLHHQGLRVPYYLANRGKYPKVQITAVSNRGRIVEAIEYTHRPAIGVQYHPEKSSLSASQPLMGWFLNRACEYKTSKEQI